ncbi:phage tail spike protein [Paenibacillus thalictri]|uniref:Uncharacterized protein n=1 Tax=Paenibacillus thalictri TaxID=2527873 RepID=A0A4Q9DPL4_9BACL|nr:phage tail spike protein [Paenibacillus thalictri]TBL76248.1 hypothetical protein EYB31_19790 [Paenibacillus thalictri]
MLVGAPALGQELLKPELYLCRNDLNKTVIARLKEAFAIRRKVSVGNLSELNFSLPYDKDERGELRRNRNADLIKERYLIKLDYGKVSEYYLIHKISDTMADDQDVKNIECMLLPYELRFKLIKNYKVTSYTIRQVLNELLAETIWTLDYIDADFEVKYRSFEMTATVLEAIQQVAEAFDAVIEYNSVNRKLSFKKLENIGTNKGLHVKYGNLLKDLTYESDSSDFCTRLKAFGKDSLSIQQLNLTGSNYIEDYSSILYPFERDEQRNVLSHSDYISDGLCHAILDYQLLVQSQQGQFSALLLQLETLQQNKTSEENVLAGLKEEFVVIDNNISLANANKMETTSLVAAKNEKQQQIDSQNEVIAGIQAQIDGIEQQINSIRDTLKLDKNFTNDQLIEWNPHIVVQEWTNDNYTDPKELYAAAIEEFNKRREPKLVVSISIVNFLEILEEQHHWEKLNLGDTITIQHDKLGVYVEAKMMEMDFDYENGDIKLTISNVRELLSDQDKFIKSLYKTISSSTSYNNNRYKIDDAFLKSSEVYQDIQNDFNAAKRTILASNNESVEISRKGIITRDLTDPSKYVVIQHGQIALTQDDGNTWGAVITPDRVVAERVKGILGEFVTLYADRVAVNPNTGAKISDHVISSAPYWNNVENATKTYSDNQSSAALNAAKTYSDAQLITATTYSNNINTAIRNDLRLQAPLPTSITLDASGITASTSDDTKFARLDYRGLYVQNGAIQITSTDGTTIIDGTGVTASTIKAGTMTGVNLTIGSGNSVFNANSNGISLGNASFGSAPFRVDMSGNVTANALTANSATINNSAYNNGSITGSSINIGNGAFTVNTAGAVTCSNIKITGGSISWSSLNSDPSIAAAQSTASNAQSAANNAYGAAQAIAAGTYTGGTFINKNLIYGPEIIGGKIKSNTTIEVETDAVIGNNIYFKPSDTTSSQSLFFGGRGSIEFRTNGVTLAANQNLILSSGSLNITAINGVFLNNKPMATQEWVQANAVAKFG